MTRTRPRDHVQRCFHADRPNQLWVVDFTYVPTWSGMAFTAFVTDVFSRRIVGWRTMNRMPTDLPLDALDMALWVRDRAGEDVTGVIQHSDAGAEYTSIRYSERLADVGAIASIGTVGDSLLTGYSILDPLRRHAEHDEVRRSSGSRVQHVSHDGQGSPAARAA